MHAILAVTSTLPLTLDHHHNQNYERTPIKGRRFISQYYRLSHLVGTSSSREGDGIGDVPLLGQREQKVQHQRGLARAGGAHDQQRDAGLHHFGHEVAQAGVLIC